MSFVNVGYKLQSVLILAGELKQATVAVVPLCNTCGASSASRATVAFIALGV